MHPSPPPEVLVLADDSASARRWADALSDGTTRVWLAADDLPAGRRPDVIVTDLAAAEIERRSGVNVDPTESTTADRVGVGLVTVGPAAWADVALSADFTSRELCLACHLVAKVARLRNQRDEFDRIRHEATKLAETDPLTGLPNRRAWEEKLASGLARSPARLWLAIVDLDHFKQVNDQLGMSKGDEVLSQAAHALAGQLRREDMVARLGGDEFGVLLWDVGGQHVQHVLDRLRNAVAEQAAPEGLARITASIGYVAGDAALDGEALFAAAEQAMRAAKRAGGDRVQRG